MGSVLLLTGPSPSKREYARPPYSEAFLDELQWQKLCQVRTGPPLRPRVRTRRPKKKRKTEYGPKYGGC